jgi:hypothetical protein
MAGRHLNAITGIFTPGLPVGCLGVIRPEKKAAETNVSRLLLYLINLLSPTRPDHYEVGKLSISANHQLCFKIPQIRKPA